ncbi:MAG: multiheme c-type cytochrome, partial [Proteobacteria bacterium]|nr:multiheme c-type cytochrome [Pseudomonadota bacterium]
MIAAWMGGCSDDPLPPRPEPLAALPAAAPVETDRFSDAAKCGQCHSAGATALRDAASRDVSPVQLWRPSMMALAARDPYYLAVFAEERARDPAHVDAIDRTCVRCHAPAGSEESAGALGFDALVAGDSPAATIGREGVTCTLCHQIASTGLGEEASFTGKFVVDYGRKIFGPHANPLVAPMQTFVSYT